MTNINEVFTEIQKSLDKELIGQNEFIKDLCSYFNYKFEKNEKGILVLIGEKETAKKTSIRRIVEYLKANYLVENSQIDEIDLGSYNFNLGYNAFLTDLYEKLSLDSACVMFTNIEKASDDILKILPNLYPNTYLNLNDEYIIKNKFLVKASNEDINKINKIVCKNKFLVYISNDEDFEIDKYFNENFKSKIDKVLHTKPLNKTERNKVVKREVLKTIRTIEKKYNIKIILDIHEDDKGDEYFGICKFLQESYQKDSNFGISEYVSYKLFKPLTNLIREENLKFTKDTVIYVKNNDIYYKANDEDFNLNEYSMPTLEEAKYKLNSIIGMEDLKLFLNNIKNNYKVQKIRERLGLKTSNISLNMIFAGNAGTGKTNAARVTFEYLNALGVLSKGVYREVSKADFVTENVADTSKRTIDIINSAIGGVLFIDEAYSLCESDDDKVGKEIVDALLKGVEDNRDDLVVILAGYEKDMEKFLTFNSGLKSRFSNIIHFEDYTPTQMYEIALNIAKSKGYRIAKNVKHDLIDLFTKNQINGKNDLGNARFVRNIVENAILDASKKYLTDKSKQIDLLERDNFNFKAKTKFDIEEKLSSIVGLTEVKSLLRNQYKLIVAQEKRKSVGVNTKIEQNLNMIFAGNPGTGKTSIARLVAEMLNSMGLLKVGQLVETDRSSFVSEIPGQTSKKTEEKFKEAIGGVLFIDEAYTLANDSLGREAIETLLKLIEDHGQDVVVILAGYEEEMEDFFDVNIGLKSRFPIWTVFKDYNPNELLEMSIKLIENKGFKLSKNAYIALKTSFEAIYEESDSQSGNGRMVRNYVESLIRNQSIRIAEEEISVYEMNLITVKDIEKINMSDYENTFDLEEKINNLKGNYKAKEFLRNQYKLMKIEERREKLGKRSNIKKYKNIIFTGDTGTGKKRVLNILSEMYFSKGLIKSKSIVEIDKDEIVYGINSGMDLEDILNKSIGKVVLIDKFDLLINEYNYNEIISMFIKFIDKNKNKIILVISGSKEGMDKIILRNQSLNYRFPLYLDFYGYDEQELYEICLDILENKGFTINEDAYEALKYTMNELYNNENMLLKNALMVKSYLDVLVRVQSCRIYDSNVNPRDINIVEKVDIFKSKKEFIDKNLDQRVYLEEHDEFNCSKEKEMNFNSIELIPSREKEIKKYSKTSQIDELLKLKNLLDLNIIDESEFKLLKYKIISNI
ncbi:AAA family ATPase [Paraclostridium ghonii]|uniref:AAA family ATPase n=1 Tax=Paraclostridium ghonii TaxID=29358 RepID=UPI0035231BCC